MSDAKESKISLKGSDFSIKPIKSVISANFITPEFLGACKEIAEYYLSTPGAVLKDFVPQAIMESGSGSGALKIVDQKFNDTAKRHEILIIQSPTEERIQHYKSIVREELAKNKSVFYACRLSPIWKKIALELGRGIEKYVFVLSGKMPKKK